LIFQNAKLTPEQMSAFKSEISLKTVEEENAINPAASFGWDMEWEWPCI
jgi:hypothetical protein